jgi:hypothetical protein
MKNVSNNSRIMMRRTSNRRSFGGRPPRGASLVMPLMSAAANRSRQRAKALRAVTIGDAEAWFARCGYDGDTE